ncbi:hypothetical protein [Pseudophaeobacter sp.]|uniref:hypothetical protein n=1 Tax=Pseudophaeobacter sp. TaxID=1971739 RepID=UPI00261FD817|nr:hypothetical protein [Pseudophaeobacter sp.]
MTIEGSIVQYTVDVEIDENSNQVIRETWRNQDGEIDRLNDAPAVTNYCPISGKPVRLKWMRNNQIHRDGDKPAIMRFDPDTGAEIVRGYWKDGKAHRPENQPQATYRSPEGSIVRRGFFVAGMRHRTDGPAIEQFDEKTGAPKRVEFWLDNLRVEPF